MPTPQLYDFPPTPVILSDGGTYTLLSAQGEPSGPCVLLPSGGVTALNNDGGALDGLTAEDKAALQAAVPADPNPEA